MSRVTPLLSNSFQTVFVLWASDPHPPFNEHRCIDARLVDDGTLDTVIEVTCAHCDSSEDVRFSDSEREEDGSLVLEWLADELDMIADDHAMACTAGSCGGDSADDGTNGQDRESYTDDQDRKSYHV